MDKPTLLTPASPDLPQTGPGGSFFGGGLFHILMRWAHISGDSLTKVRERIVVLALLAWLPLLAISAFEGQLLGGSVAVPFLLDVEAHMRFLVALPLFIVAEVVAHRRMPPLLRQFHDRHLVDDSAMPRFNEAVASASRLSSSVLAELLIVAFVYGVGILIVWRQFVALDASTWYATSSAQGSKLTLAGMWYGFVSLPIVQFLQLRWYWRLFVWARFLWQVSRIRLSLVPAHPDRFGGLAFLSRAAYALTLVATAHGALAAGNIASRIFFAGAVLPEFIQQVFALVVIMACLILGPLLVFTPQLVEAKHAAMREYAHLAERYVREFEAKWLRGGAPAGEALVGSADIQSLADLGNSYDGVRSMRVAPISSHAIALLTIATVAPIAPLLLTMIPLDDLLKKLVGMVF